MKRDYLTFESEATQCTATLIVNGVAKTVTIILSKNGRVVTDTVETDAFETLLNDALNTPDWLLAILDHYPTTYDALAVHFAGSPDSEF